MTAHPHASLLIHPIYLPLRNTSFFIQFQFQLPSLSIFNTRKARMATDGPSWADQWGEGGFGAMADEDTKSNKETAADKKTGGLGKAKAAAVAGALKVKNSTSMSLKWVKNKCQKKTSNT